MNVLPDNNRSLRLLAGLYGIQAGYFDISGTFREASDESLVAMLQALGAPLAGLKDLAGAWREYFASRQRLAEPVIVCWDSEPAAVRIRLPAASGELIVGCHLWLESGDELVWQWRPDDADTARFLSLDGASSLVRSHRLPGGLAPGYHRLTLEVGGRDETSLVISAPLRAYSPEAADEKRGWGVFLPLYSLHTRRSWGAGDLADLAGLAAWVRELGGDTVATLPLLAAFLNDDYSEPSPYLPASRLAWNEFHLDVLSVPELDDSPEAQAILDSGPFRSDIEALREQSLVDYPRQMALKRQILELLCQRLFARGGRRLEELDRFAGANPIVADYARFRAVGEKQHAPWPEWPGALGDGTVGEDDYDETARRYHLYAQWLMDAQLAGISARNRDGGVRLYLDLPLGVHPAGYEVWREPEAFIPGVTTGAPPDTVFTRGQDWSFPPPHPERARDQGYRYFIACLRHSLKHTSVLRLDHVMGLHRLFCIPRGMAPDQGVYLGYHASELYAILALESQRSRAVIIGEDLGMVPPYVRPAMERHGLKNLYVMRYELTSDCATGPAPPGASAVASLNTHDMFPFAGFWQGREISDRLGLGIVTPEAATREKAELPMVKSALICFLRQHGWLDEAEDIPALLKACLRFLASSRAPLVLVNLEDLWLETAPQNIPSTSREYPNWRHRAGYGLEEFREMEALVTALRMLNDLRRQITTENVSNL